MHHIYEDQRFRAGLSRGSCFGQFIVLLMLAGNPLSAGAQLLPVPPANDMNPAEIVWRMVARNQTLAHELGYSSSLRHYHLDVRGLGPDMSADMHVQVTYIAGSGKTLQVVDESGSRLLLTRVLEKLIASEQIQSLQPTASLTPFNYNFTFDGESRIGAQRLYVFSVEPKAKSNLLYHRRLKHDLFFRGKVWIDAKEFAVVRVETEPAMTPSSWIKSAAIHHSYEKHGGFWLPPANKTESKLRPGGTAVLTIDYGSGRFDRAASVAQSSTDEQDSSQALLKVQ